MQASSTPHPPPAPRTTANTTPGPAIITGGAGGLGLAIARRLAAAGHTIALWDMDSERLQAALNALSDAHPDADDDIIRITGWPVDVTNPDDVAQATAQVVRVHGPLEVLVTCAGHNGPIAALADYPLDDWRFVMKLNLDAVFYCCQAAVREMRQTGYGRIVNLASIAGKEGNPNAAAYSAAKAGVMALTKSLGKELAHTQIRVNCVAPAAIETDMLQQVSDEFRNYVVSRIPVGRLGQADEVAALVAWLASKDCSFSTGAVFDASGGRATY